MNLYARLPLSILALVGSSAFAFGQESTPTPLPPNTMSIIGQGQFWTAPEIAEFSGEVVTRGATLAEARDAHPDPAQAARETIDGLAAGGLELESAQYSMREIDPCDPYGYARQLNDAPPCNEEPYFEATTRYQLSSANLTNLGDVVSTLAAQELLVSRIAFKVKDRRTPLLEARKDAARDALEQAEAYAEALGVELVDIRNVTDGDATPVEGYADLGVLTPGPTPKIPIEIAVPDQLEFNASVRVDWTVNRIAP